MSLTGGNGKLRKASDFTQEKKHGKSDQRETKIQDTYGILDKNVVMPVWQAMQNELHQRRNMKITSRQYDTVICYTK